MAFPTSPAPNHVEEASTSYNVKVKLALDGTTHKRLHQADELRTWRLVYDYLDEADQSTLDTYYATQKGAYGSDTWTTPQGESVTVRIDRLVRRTAVGDLRTYEITLEEEPA